MNEPIVIIGIGEMAGVFSRGFLKLGHPVFPVTRDMDMEQVAKVLTPPCLTLVAVGERDLGEVLGKVPALWRDRLCLLQNELLPRDWEAHEVEDPTVVAVWFEKKKGQDYRVLVPSPVYGPQAALVVRALEALGIPTWALTGAEELLFELVRKNVYILTTNIAGLAVGGTVDDLWHRHQELARAIAEEVMAIQFRLIGRELDRERLLEGMLAAILGDPAHKCLGRAAPERLERVLAHADREGLAVPTLRQIRQKSST